MKKISCILLVLLGFFSLSALEFIVPEGETRETTLDLPNDGDRAIIEKGGAIVPTAAGDKGVTMNGNNQRALNQGLISTTGIEADGINNGGNNSFVENRGLIITDGSAAFGIFNDGGSNVTLTNTGKILILQNGEGMSSNGLNTTMVNSGEISTLGDNAIGMVTVADNNRIINSGQILTTGEISPGFEIGEAVNVVFTNSGLIAVTGSGSSGITTRGPPDNFQIVNSGIIRSAQSFAINLNEGINATLTLLRGSNLQGPVTSIEDVLNLNVETGLNLALTLDPTSMGFGTLGIEAPYILLDDDLIGVIDPTGFVMQSDMVADLSDAILDGIYRYRTGFPCFCAPCGCGVWIQGIGSSRKRGHDKAFVGYDNWQGGFLVGVNANLYGTNTGLFGGVSFGEAIVDQETQRAETTSYVAGVTYEWLFCNTFVGTAVVAGYVDWDNERFVMNNLAEGGVERARTDTGGGFVTADLTVAHHFNQLLCSTMSFSLRYAGLFLGNYHEKGSLTNISVKDRETDLLTTRLELSLPWTESRGICCWNVEPYIGVFGRYLVGGYHVDGVLLDQPICFELGEPRNLAAFFFGFRGTQSVGCCNLFLNLEASFDNYSSSRILGEGGIGISF